MTSTTDRDNDSLTAARLMLALAVGYALFDLLPVVLSDVSAFKGLTWGDIVDVPIVVLPVALLFHLALDAGLWRSVGLRAVLLLALLLFVQGHAIHLAANAISHHLGTSSPAWEATYFLDEHLGHYEMHAALITLALLFVSQGRRSRLAGRPDYAIFALSILGFGSLIAAGAIEGQTVPLVLPASVALVVMGLLVSGRHATEYATFFSATYAVCLVVLIVYGVINGGWPEIL